MFSQAVLLALAAAGLTREQAYEIVQRNAELHGVRYVAQHSLAAALRSHFRHLRTMGRMGVPIALEMG